MVHAPGSTPKRAHARPSTIGLRSAGTRSGSRQIAAIPGIPSAAAAQQVHAFLSYLTNGLRARYKKNTGSPREMSSNPAAASTGLV